jgi:hypothetical protein
VVTNPKTLALWRLILYRVEFSKSMWVTLPADVLRQWGVSQDAKIDALKRLAIVRDQAGDADSIQERVADRVKSPRLEREINDHVFGFQISSTSRGPPFTRLMAIFPTRSNDAKVDALKRLEQIGMITVRRPGGGYLKVRLNRKSKNGRNK